MQSAGKALLVSVCGAPSSYCTPKTNSLGCVPALAASGPASMGGAPLVVTATQVINQNWGIAFWGHGPLEQPLFGGFLCVLPPLRRNVNAFSGGSALPTSDCSGALEYTLSGGQLANHGVGAGDRIYLQVWYRDPQHPDGTGIGLTGGLEIPVCP